MHIICEKNVLLNAINVVSKAISNKSTLQILECILIEVKDGKLRMIGNDLSLGIEAININCEIISPGSIALEAKILLEIVRNMPDGKISVSTDEKNITLIKCGKSEFKILGLDGEQFPYLSEVEKNNNYLINSKDFKSLIKHTIFSVATEELRPVMLGELIEFNEDYIKMTAVDGYRVAESFIHTDLNAGRVTSKIIVPGKTLSEINKILVNDDEMINIYFSERHVLFELNNIKIISRLINGEFINYENIFATESTTEMLINKEMLSESLDRAMLISKDSKKAPVVFKADSDILIITSNNEIGNVYEELNINLDGNPITIAFNPKYLIDIFKAVDDENITIQFTTPLSPAIIKIENNKNYRFIVLPLRLKS